VPHKYLKTEKKDIPLPFTKSPTPQAEVFSSDIAPSGFDHDGLMSCSPRMGGNDAEPEKSL